MSSHNAVDPGTEAPASVTRVTSANALDVFGAEAVGEEQRQGSTERPTPFPPDAAHALEASSWNATESDTAPEWMTSPSVPTLRVKRAHDPDLHRASLDIFNSEDVAVDRSVANPPDASAAEQSAPAPAAFDPLPLAWMTRTGRARMWLRRLMPTHAHLELVVRRLTSDWSSVGTRVDKLVAGADMRAIRRTLRPFGHAWAVVRRSIASASRLRTRVAHTRAARIDLRVVRVLLERLASVSNASVVGPAILVVMSGALMLYAAGRWGRPQVVSSAPTPKQLSNELPTGSRVGSARADLSSAVIAVPPKSGVSPEAKKHDPSQGKTLTAPVEPPVSRQGSGLAAPASSAARVTNEPTQTGVGQSAPVAQVAAADERIVRVAAPQLAATSTPSPAGPPSAPALQGLQAAVSPASSATLEAGTLSPTVTLPSAGTTVTGSPAVALPPAAPDPIGSTLVGASAAGTAAAARPVADEDAVRTILDKYRMAYNELDAGGARTVWPAVDVVALSKAFDQLASQAIEFTACDVSVTGERARAVCGGHASFVPKVGRRDARRAAREWRFQLRRAGDGWIIAGMEMR